MLGIGNRLVPENAEHVLGGKTDPRCPGKKLNCEQEGFRIDGRDVASDLLAPPSLSDFFQPFLQVWAAQKSAFRRGIVNNLKNLRQTAVLPAITDYHAGARTISLAGIARKGLRFAKFAEWGGYLTRGIRRGQIPSQPPMEMMLTATGQESQMVRARQELSW